jgi:NAD-dependent deacetylase sirtuin 2
VIPKMDCPHVSHCVRSNIIDNLTHVDIVSGPCQHYGRMPRQFSRKRLRDEEEDEKAGAAGKLKCEDDYEDGGALGENKTTTSSCPPGENWLCLTCGALLCSRYANGHAKMHWEDTKSEDCIDDEAVGKTGVNYGNHHSSGHCVAVSLGDLSVWCYECGAYLVHPSLEAITKKLEDMKFGKDENGSVENDEMKEEQIQNSQSELTNVEELQDLAADHNADDASNATSCHNGGGTSNKVSKRKSQPTKLDPEKSGFTEFTSSRDNSTNGNSVSANDNPSDSEQEEDESDHQAALLASLLHSEHGEAIRAYLSRHSSFNPGDMSQCVPMHMPAPPAFPGEMAEFLLSPLCKSVIVLAGAGMSVSSGIPDFRSAGVGLYDTLQPDLLTASEIERELIAEDPTLALDKGMFLRNPLPMLELKRDFILGTQEARWKSTIAHRFVEFLHTKLGKLTRIYTQNIDGLELQCKGLPKEKVVNVHGSMGSAACESCETEVDFDDFCSKVRSSVKDITGQSPDAPSESKPIVCEACGKPTVKPTIVLFRGSMPKEFHERTAEDLGDCDLLIIMGTSLTVSPANSLVYRIPPTCLRLVVNNQRVGRMLGIDYSENSIRDVFAHGHSDEMCLDLMDKLGWLDDLASIMDDLPESNAKMLRERLAQKAE